MRKDRIEERISGIERDVKELRSEIRQELRSMIAELKEFQELMIDERVSGIEEVLSKQYCHTAYESCTVRAKETFDEQMSHDCPPGEREPCIEHFVSGHFKASIDDLENARPEAVAETIDSIVARDAGEWKSLEGTGCEQCLKVYYRERGRLLEMGEKFAQHRKSLSAKRSDLYFRQLPDDLAVSEIVDPLSHKARFAMLKSLTSGNKSYKELGEITGYTGGHLLYHVKKLVMADLVSKEESGGLYQITEKGIGVMEVVKKMYAR